MKQLHRFASTRTASIQNGTHADKEIYQSRLNRVTDTLKFAEETFLGWIPGSHFELCVFVDSEQPLLFGYFDSGHKITARSKAVREKNHLYYVEKEYEVTKFLKKPSSRPRFLMDTHEKNANYKFTTSGQGEQLRSTILICLDLETPCALVLTSNEKMHFQKKIQSLCLL